MKKQIASVINKLLDPMNLKLVRARVLQPVVESVSEGYSYLGEEEVLAKLRGRIALRNSVYVDIGAADGVSGSNTVHLARDGWHGLCVDGDLANVAKMARLYQQLDNVFVCHAWVTPPTVVNLLKAYSIPRDLAVLSFDIDSYDYFVLDALLEEFRPSIIIAEINERIPPPVAFTVRFSEDQSWNSDAFFGMSVQQAAILAERHGYGIVELEYNNIFLVDTARWDGKFLTPAEAYATGFLNRPDRDAKFPWIAQVHHWLTATPEELVEILNQEFAMYDGRYEIEIVRTPHEI